MLFTKSSLLVLIPFTLAAPLNITSNLLAPGPNIYETCTNRVNYELNTLTKYLDQIMRERPQGRSAIASRITDQSNRVIFAIKDGAGAMRSAPPASTMEATALIGPVTTLTSTTKGITSKWLQIKDIVYQMNGQQKVIQILQDTKSAGAQFSLAMNAKMPILYKETGKLFGNEVDTMVRDVIGAYQQPPRGPVMPGWY